MGGLVLRTSVSALGLGYSMGAPATVAATMKPLPATTIAATPAEAAAAKAAAAMIAAAATALTATKASSLGLRAEKGQTH